MSATKTKSSTSEARGSYSSRSSKAPATSKIPAKTVKTNAATSNPTKIIDPSAPSDIVTAAVVPSLNDAEWFKLLQEYLNNILMDIMPDGIDDSGKVRVNNDRMKFLDADAMLIWGAAFTHQSYDYNYNYESLEYVGDALLKHIFPQYMIRRDPLLTEEDLSNLNTNYMATVYQAQLSQKMKLSADGKLRQVGYDWAGPLLDADLFESFFGALSTIGDNITFGLGTVYSYNKLALIFKDIKIEEKYKEGSSKTQMQQLFSRFQLKTPIQEDIEIPINDNITRSRVTIRLTDEQRAFLENYGVRIKVTDPIGVGIAQTKAQAEYQAYSNALEFLADKGITTKWAKDIKEQKDFELPEVEPYAKAAFAIAKQMGLVKLYFNNIRKLKKSTGNTVIQLLGNKRDGTRVRLESIVTKKSANMYEEAKALLLRNFIEHNNSR